MPARVTEPGIVVIGCVLAAMPNLLAAQVNNSADPQTQFLSQSAHSQPLPAPVSYADDAQRIEVIEQSIRDAKYLEIELPLRQYLRDYPFSARAHYDLGYVLFRERGGALSLADAIKESIKELSRSLELDVNNADAHKVLALDLTMIQKDDMAEVELKQAVRLDPTSAEIHYLLGRHYMGKSMHSQARVELERAIQLDPDYMKAYDNLGITMDRLGDAPAALKNYQMAIDLDEHQSLPSEYPYLDFAIYYHDRNQDDAALRLIQKALKTNPRSDEAFYELAKIDVDTSKLNEALDALLKAIELDPYSAQYYYLLGRTYRSLGKLDESKQAFANYSKYRKLSEALSEPNDYR